MGGPVVAPVTRGEGGGEGDGGLPWVMMDRKDEAFVPSKGRVP